MSLPVLRRWSKVYFVLWWLVSSVLWVNLFLALILEVQRPLPACLDLAGKFSAGSRWPELGLCPSPGLSTAHLLLGGSGNTPDI